MMKMVFIAILLVVVMVRRQLQARPVKTNMFSFPLLVLAFGVYEAAQAGVQTGEGISLLLGALMGAAVGWWQGAFTRVYEERGVLYTVGSVGSILIWFASIPIRLVIKYGFVLLLDIPIHLTGDYMYVPYLISLAGIWIGRSCYLMAKHAYVAQKVGMGGSRRYMG